MRHAIVAFFVVAFFAASPLLAQTSAPAATSDPQRAILFEENADRGNSFEGVAAWRLENVAPGSGAAAATMIKAIVTVPERQMSITWSLRRNKDRELPATHIIGVVFNLPPDFSEGSVAQVPGMLMKQAVSAKAAALVGFPAKVTSNSFTFGLSAAETAATNNIKLLKEMDWIDIPVVYADGHRAILAVQKGRPGGRAFAKAFAAWDH